MQVGRQGDRGPIGDIGPTGTASDVTGATGIDGYSPQGATGFIGDEGEQNIFVGANGPTGAQGTPGGDGAIGVDGDVTKMAIVPSIAGPVSLCCTETPEVWFEDIQIYEVGKMFFSFPLDPIFLSVCEAVHVASCVCNKAVSFACRVFIDEVQISHSSEENLKFTVTFRGKRSGFGIHRFLRHTDEEMHHNHVFWAQARL